MTNEQAKALGERALALGMPWVDGLMNGLCAMRVGDLIFADDVYKSPAWRHKPKENSWPDFRDPVTEAWLVAWASDFLARRGWGVDEEPGQESLETGMGRPWLLYLSHNEMFIDASGKSRAEAWILALEKLKGEGSS